ncbi:hypothetical protein P4O66_012950, partial [Electrophorus voltai]
RKRRSQSTPRTSRKTGEAEVRRPAGGRMLENKRERLKTFLRKIDEKAIFRIKHLMKESCPAEGGASPTRIRAGRTKSLKRKTETRKALSLEEAQLEMQQQTTSRLALPRSQTFAGDRSLEKSDSANSRTSFIKHNKTFHKLFPDVPENEDLVHAYICALQREVPYHGRLYITESNVCFHSSVLLKATKVVIPVSSIHVLKKQNTALLVPNALSIRTNIGEKYLFVSLRNRESCYKLLLSVCPLLEDGSANSSPIFSSAENSLDHGKLVNSSQSSLTDAFEELDGSSSGLLLQPPPSRHNRGTVSNASPLGEQDESSTEEYSGKTHIPRTKEICQGSLCSGCLWTYLFPGGSWVWSVTDRARSLITQREATNLNTLLLIYLMLVLLLLLSSGYIGLRIVALEEQLTSLGALPEFTLHSSPAPAPRTAVFSRSQTPDLTPQGLRIRRVFGSGVLLVERGHSSGVCGGTMAGACGVGGDGTF